MAKIKATIGQIDLSLTPLKELIRAARPKKRPNTAELIYADAEEINSGVSSLDAGKFSDRSEFRQNARMYRRMSESASALAHARGNEEKREALLYLAKMQQRLALRYEALAE